MNLLYRTIWLLLDSIHHLVCGSFTKDHNVSETGSVSVLRWMWSFVKLPHTRRWIESKRSQIVLYNIHHRQNPFKSMNLLVKILSFLRVCIKKHFSLHKHKPRISCEVKTSLFKMDQNSISSGPVLHSIYVLTEQFFHMNTTESACLHHTQTESKHT
jgi:hypothetical protein